MKENKEIKVEKIVIKIKDKKVELTVDEAKLLLSELKNVLGDNVVSSPYWYVYGTWTNPVYTTPIITCTPTYGNTIGTYGNTTGTYSEIKQVQ